MSYCLKCGQYLKEGTQFCGNCGEPIASAGSQTEGGTQTNYAGQAKVPSMLPPSGSRHFCCPKCGNRELQATVETNTSSTGGGYSGTKGCLGFLLLGPLGLLCGSCGQQQKTETTNQTFWLCPKCGNRFRNPDDIRKSIKEAESGRKVLRVFGIIIIVLTILLVISAIAGEMMEFLWPVILLIGLLGGFFYWLSMPPKNDKLQEELKEVESGMERFLRE